MSSDFYQHPDLYDVLLPVGAHLPFYCDLARNHPEGVLELACGTGQLTVPIAGLVAQVVGLDRSTAMLRSARARAADVGVACTFVEGDMRHFNLVRSLSTGAAAIGTGGWPGVAGSLWGLVEASV